MRFLFETRRAVARCGLGCRSLVNRLGPDELSSWRDVKQRGKKKAPSCSKPAVGSWLSAQTTFLNEKGRVGCSGRSRYPVSACPSSTSMPGTDQRWRPETIRRDRRLRSKPDPICSLASVEVQGRSFPVLMFFIRLGFWLGAQSEVPGKAALVASHGRLAVPCETSCPILPLALLSDGVSSPIAGPRRLPPTSPPARPFPAADATALASSCLAQDRLFAAMKDLLQRAVPGEEESGGADWGL